MATTIANNAVMKCQLSGMPMTADNVIAFVGDFFDPADPHYEPLSEYILAAIDEFIDCVPIEANLN